MTVAVTVGATLMVDINPDDYDTKEDMLKAAEDNAMLHLEELDNFYVLDSEIAYD